MPKRKKTEAEAATKICDFSTESNAEELKVLTRDPAYVCKSCGRSAASDRSLCQPERMYTAW